MPSDDQIIGPGGFGAFLVSIGGGTLHGELTHDLQRLVQAIEDHVRHTGERKAKGSLAIKIRLELDAKTECFAVVVEYEAKIPRAPSHGAVMWADAHHNLQPANPGQRRLPFAEVGAPRAVRTVEG